MCGQVYQVLLRNEKRGHATFESSQVSTEVLVDEPTLAEEPSMPGPQLTVPFPPKEEYAISAVMKDNEE